MNPRPIGIWGAIVVLVLVACASCLAVAKVVLAQAEAGHGETPAVEVVPRAMKFVRVRLGKKTTAGAGDLGQPITSYFARVNIGSPPKPFSLLVDVNARENFVPHHSKLGFVCWRLNYSNGYRKKDSSTSEKQEETQSLTMGYNGCTLTGKAYTDVFEFQNVTESYKRTEFRQRFLAMSSASNNRFVRYAVDGVLALNPWPISATGSELATVNMARADLMGELKFALSLQEDNGPNQDHQGNEMPGGELTLGAANPTKFLGALRFHPVVAQHAWEVQLAGVMLGARPVAACADAQCQALLSTRDNGITGPATAIRELMSLLGVGAASNASESGHLYTVDCEMRQTAPELSFFIEDARYSIPAKAYVRFKKAGSGVKQAVCYLDLYSSLEANNKWELGTHFLSNFYTVFDINSRKVALGSALKPGA